MPCRGCPVSPSLSLATEPKGMLWKWHSAGGSSPKYRGVCPAVGMSSSLVKNHCGKWYPWHGDSSTPRLYECFVPLKLYVSFNFKFPSSLSFQPFLDAQEQAIKGIF